MLRECLYQCWEAMSSIHMSQYQTRTIRPLSNSQNSQAHVTNRSEPTCHPTCLATASQSHFLPYKNFSHAPNPSGKLHGERGDRVGFR